MSFKFNSGRGAIICDVCRVIIYENLPANQKQVGHICNDCLKEIREQKRTPDPDINKCPNCGGPADNGFDRCDPPNPYFCTKCEDEEDE